MKGAEHESNMYVQAARRIAAEDERSSKAAWDHHECHDTANPVGMGETHGMNLERRAADEAI